MERKEKNPQIKNALSCIKKEITNEMRKSKLSYLLDLLKLQKNQKHQLQQKNVLLTDDLYHLHVKILRLTTYKEALKQKSSNVSLGQKGREEECMKKVLFEEKFSESEEMEEEEEVEENLLSPLAQKLVLRLKEEKKNKK